MQEQKDLMKEGEERIRIIKKRKKKMQTNDKNKSNDKHEEQVWIW